MRLLRRKTKKADANGKIELERVIGLTTTNASGLASNAATGDVAYLAGCVVVIYNIKTNCQMRFLVNTRTSKALSCVAYSYQGGKFLAAGESGHQPAVVIWDSISGQFMMELKTHKIGISCIEFSPNGKHLVSVGVPHDGFLCLWEWRSGSLLAKTRTTTAASPICSVRFASDGSFFITAGIKHLRQWSIAQSTRTRPVSAGSATLEGRAVNLGSQKDGSFVSISCASSKETNNGGGQTAGIQPIYVLTNEGVLCLLHFGIAVEKWVDLKVRHGFDLAVSETYIACACSDGIVRFFVLGSLAYTATLPRPAPYGYHGLTDSSMYTALSVGHVQGLSYPDAVACSFLAGGDRIAVVYGDHSLYIWDVRNFSKIGRCRTFFGHSGCIWDVTTVPQLQVQLLKSKVGKENVLAGESFATCSADGSIRLWSVCPDKDLSQAVTSKSANLYCKDILGVIYMDANDLWKPSSEHEGNSEKPAHGFRAISISLDGKYLASGDRSGNLRVYDLTSLELVTFQEAHDAEILSLSFGASVDSTSVQAAPLSLLASGGRDRLVHVYDVNRNFDVIETLDDHSASITRVKFACGVTKLLSCSADKSVVFRQVQATENGTRSTRYHQEVAPRGTIYDMDVHPNDKFVVTVGQDKKVNILNLANGKSIRCIKPDADVGEPIKVRVDPSGTFMICSHSDKCMRLYDFASGEMLTQASGHAEVITGMTWLPDCKHLISVSGDSCIFIWRLPPIMSRTMKRKLVSQAEAQPPPRYLKSALKRSHIGRLSCRTSKNSSSRPKVMDGTESVRGMEEENATSAIAHQEGEEAPAFKFSVSRLPSWAQSKVEEEKSECTKKTPTEKSDGNAFHSAESRWVERVGNEGYKLATEASEETPPTIHVSGFGARRRFSVEGTVINQDSTPESSINSQTDGSPMSSPRDPPRRETQWKTVHTVFFDEMDFLHDEEPTNCNNPASVTTSSEGKNQQHLNDECYAFERISNSTLSVTGENEDGVVVYLPEDDNSEILAKQDGTAIQTAAFPSASSTPRREGSFVVSSKYKHLGFEDWGPVQAQSSVIDIGKREIMKVNIGSPFECSNPSTGDESDGCDDDVSPCKDLFSAHFDKLSSAAKVDSSTRSSLSARFFARTVRTPISKSANAQEANVQDDLLKEDDLSTNTGCLAAERERLKLQQRQDKMASEVQRMRERLVNLGIAVCEGGKAEKTKHSEEASVSPVKGREIVKCSQADENTPVTKQPQRPANRSSDSSFEKGSFEDANEMPMQGRSHLPDNEEPEKQAAVEGSSEPNELACHNESVPGPSARELVLGDAEEYTTPRDSLHHVSDISSGFLPRPQREYIAALQDLERAAEKASKLISELESMKALPANVKQPSSPALDLTKLTESYQNVLPGALQKMQRLADQISAHHITRLIAETRQADLVDTGASRPGTSSSNAGSDIVHSSVDIEGLLERYSLRFSENLAHQVLALVQKGLGSDSK